MNAPDPRLRDFHHDGYRWCADAYLLCWGGDLTIRCHTHKPEPMARQERIVRAILDYPNDLRVLVEHNLFAYYEQEVYGTIDFGDAEAEQECAPLLTKPAQIWKLVDEAEIWIDDYFQAEYEATVEFKITFACTWNEEHGLGVKFRDWQIVVFTSARRVESRDCGVVSMLTESESEAEVIARPGGTV